MKLSLFTLLGGNACDLSYPNTGICKSCGVPAADTAYRCGLPPFGALARHAANGGRWHAQYMGGPCLVGSMDVHNGIVLAGFPGTDGLNLDKWKQDVLPGWWFRPCLIDGTPVPWEELE